MPLIDYDRPVLDLRAGLDATGHITHGDYAKDMLTYHHNGGIFTARQVLAIWAYRPASAHFDVDRNQDIAQYCETHDYAWACANAEGNRRSVSIEMSNSSGSPNWLVDIATWKAGARLGGFLFAKGYIKGEPTKDTVVFHHHWYPTACAGPYMDRAYDDLLGATQDAYRHFKGTSPQPKPTPDPKQPTYYVGARVQKAWAKLLGTPRDGEISSQDAGQKECFWPDLWPCIQWVSPGKARGSQLVVAFQRAHGLKADGLIGHHTMAAIQRWVGVLPDGVGGEKTTAALCHKLGF